MGIAMPQAKKNMLKQLYYEPKTGFQSFTKFYRTVKEKDPSVKLKDVKAFLERQHTAQVNKVTVRPKIYNTILANKVGDNFQTDILVYDRYEIHKYKYILVCVDVNSRYAQAKALTNRNNETLVQAFKEIFEVMGVPKNLNADNEFRTGKLLEFFNKNKIVCHFSDVGEINKQAIVERLNRTLASLLQRWRVGTGQRAWYKVLPAIIDNYNNSYHRTIRAKPSDVFAGKEKNRQARIYQLDPEFKVNDIVRYKEVRPVLGKGDYLKYSTSTYLITEAKGKRYMLENTETREKTKRYYKAYELRKANEIETWEPPETVEDERTVDELLKESKKNKAVKRLAKELGSAWGDAEIPQELWDSRVNRRGTLRNRNK